LSRKNYLSVPLYTDCVTQCCSFYVFPLSLQPFIIALFSFGKECIIPDFGSVLTVIGLALSIYIGTRVRIAYDRWWEGRKLWGRMINRSRILSRQFLQFIDHLEEHSKEIKQLQKKLILRHIAYIHTHRVCLRGESISEDESCIRFLSKEEQEQLSKESNPCNALICMQGEDLREAFRNGWISEQRLQQIDLSFVELLDVQGGNERIQKTPVPPSFTYFSTRLVFLYTILLSFGLVQTLHWWVIPTVMVVGFIFRILDTAGRLIEDPFNTFIYGLPLYGMSRTIEANLCDRIDHERRDIPKAINGILM
jgi:ion channel-forming bestrophin family protein